MQDLETVSKKPSFFLQWWWVTREHHTGYSKPPEDQYHSSSRWVTGVSSAGWLHCSFLVNWNWYLSVVNWRSVHYTLCCFKFLNIKSLQKQAFNSLVFSLIASQMLWTFLHSDMVIWTVESLHYLLSCFPHLPWWITNLTDTSTVDSLYKLSNYLHALSSKVYEHTSQTKICPEHVLSLFGILIHYITTVEHACQTTAAAKHLLKLKSSFKPSNNLSNHWCCSLIQL